MDSITVSREACGTETPKADVSVQVQTPEKTSVVAVFRQEEVSLDLLLCSTYAFT